MPGPDQCSNKDLMTIHMHIPDSVNARRGCAKLIESLTDTTKEVTRIFPEKNAKLQQFVVLDKNYQRVIYVRPEFYEAFKKLTLAQVRDLYTAFFFRVLPQYGSQNYDYCKPKWYDGRTVFETGEDS